jgi:uncharacterized protein (TIGR03083 family)
VTTDGAERARVHSCHRAAHGDYVDAAAAEIERFAVLIDGADPAAPVPSCPQWSMRDLVTHLGQTHRWAEHLVRLRAAARIPPREMDLDAPAGAETYAGWLREGAHRLGETLASADPDAPMWAWGADQHARFWSRRMLHETAVHRVDAQLALGETATYDERFATDGVDELLDNLPGAVRFAPGVVELRGDECWTVALHPAGFSWDHGHVDGTVNVSGATTDLLLLLYRRDDVRPRLEVTGRDDVLEKWLRHSAI